MEAQALALEVERAAVLFARLGAAVMLLPGLGEREVPVRVRLVFALWLTLLGLPVLGAEIVPPADDGALLRLLTVEITTGLMLGASARIVVGALHLAGSIVAALATLSAASLFDPRQGGPTTIPSQLYFVAGTTLLLVLDLHHFLLAGLFGSYEAIPTGEFAAGEAAEWLARVSTAIWPLALRLAAPVVLVGLASQIALGLAARLVPGIQIFLVALPLQILVALAAFGMGAAAALAVFARSFAEQLSGFALG